MKKFFGDDVLLSSETAKELYASVKDLPIIDYHCHLDDGEIAKNHSFSDIGELWLAADHYKWRAMRLCGVDEKYITGDASFKEKFLKYAEIFPRLCGNPLYYWTQMELKMIFGISTPLSADTAEEIYAKANEKLAGKTVADILKQFRVEYIATTDDATATLHNHGKYGETSVCPTFRPDKILGFDTAAMALLAEQHGAPLDSLCELKKALSERIAFFRSKNCRISDHGMDFLPLPDCGEERANELYAKRDSLSSEEKHELSSHLLYFLAEIYAREGMVMQLHFATFRCVNTKTFALCGRDSGFDIMRGEVDTDALVYFLDTLTARDALPKTVLYTLNPACAPALATLSGAFREVRVGAAWWFNDTLLGIRRQLEVVAEYAALGTNLGMLTDSRSFASYARFDFFRRILADLVGEYVEKGEYDLLAAKQLMRDVCYNNIKGFLAL
ncbi:MAG: glucuronate isomerase [Ruminococcaceae bacterium]|nr:glucuronate isomerase [Oscillospiraceae bacterium]